MPRNFVKKRIYIGVLMILSLFCAERLLCRFLFLKASNNDPILNISYTPYEFEHIKSILKQPLHFLGAGSQCIAFASKDDQYVIKICKAPRYKHPGKKEADFLSYLLAFQELPQESQIIFLHLHLSNSLQISLKIIDPLGIPHFLNADQLCFYVQKKLTPFQDYIKPLLPTLSITQARDITNEILTLCATSSQHPLQVRDIQFKNIGIREHKFFWMDAGRIRKKNVLVSKEEQKKEFMRLISRLKPSLTSLHPVFKAVLEEEIQKKLQELS